MILDSTDDAPSESIRANPRLNRAVSLVAQHLGDGAVLDVGCWTGSVGRALAGIAQCMYTGVDIESAAQAVAAARVAAPEQRFLVVPSVESLPFDAESFDVVVFTETLGVS